MAKLLAESGRAALLALNALTQEPNKYLKDVASSRVGEFLRYCSEVESRIPG